MNPWLQRKMYHCPQCGAAYLHDLAYWHAVYKCRFARSQAAAHGPRTVAFGASAANGSSSSLDDGQDTQIVNHSTRRQDDVPRQQRDRSAEQQEATY